MNDAMACSSPKILIIEDSKDLRELLKVQLCELSLECEIVEDGIEALGIILRGMKGSQAYPVVILDCAMPFMDGFTTARVIRCWEANNVLPFRTKIGMYTGYSNLLQPSTLLESTDIDEFVSKTDPESLVAMVRKLIEDV